MEIGGPGSQAFTSLVLSPLGSTDSEAIDFLSLKHRLRETGIFQTRIKSPALMTVIFSKLWSYPLVEPTIGGKRTKLDLDGV